MIRLYSMALAGTVLATAPASAAAQLRPQEPLDWHALDTPGVSGAVGVAYLHGQRASLAGSEGGLWELVDVAVSWTLERVMLTVSGTALQVYDDDHVFAPPVAGTRAPDGRRRVDTGAYLVETVVLLTPGSRDAAVALRLGTRLPTTDNRVGLGRDQTDFFSMMAGRLRRDRWLLSAEAGLSITATRDPDNEQVDPVLFAGQARYEGGAVWPYLAFTGQHDTRAGREPRGTENLGEVRLGIRTGGARWIRFEAIRGWTRMGPELGARATVGMRF